MKKKIFVSSFPVLIVGIICFIMLGTPTKEKEEQDFIVDTDKLIGYTIDGEIATEKPTKEAGYIVNTISCDNNSDIMWDNDNWKVELTNVKSNDRCTVDFTKNIDRPGYRITVTSNNTASLDSTSKSTVENGTVIIYSSSPVTNVTGCNGRIEDNKVIVENIASNETCNISIEDNTLASVIKAAYPPLPGRTDFSTIDNETPALYTDTDDQGTTYYFSGDGSTMNNWVSFAGKLWRIIRINGNGSVRLLYAGTGGEDGYIGSVQAYNTSYDHPAYVGWKYTKGGSLTADRENESKGNAYTTVETWYNDLSTTDKNYIDTTAIYCNDRGLASEYSYSTSSTFYYAARERLEINKAPTFKCSDTADRFTTFGLMTADEVAYAGGVLHGTNSPKAYYYLNSSGGSSTGSNLWWTMSPYNYYWDSSSGYTHVFFVLGSGFPGYLSYGWGADSGTIRPVISLKSSVLVTGGSGSGNDPYTVTIQ